MGKNIFVKTIDNNTNMKSELLDIGFDSSYVDRAEKKYLYRTIKIFNVKNSEALILKQTALSLKGDCAIHRGVIVNRTEYSNCILSLSLKQFEQLIDKLYSQPFYGLKIISKRIEESVFPKSFVELEILGKRFDFNTKKYSMGILNLTTDSFSDGGKFIEIEKAMDQIDIMVKSSIDIIDIGAESTRPGAKEISSKIEIDRIKPILTLLRERYPKVVVSIDTRHSDTAQFCLDLGANIINDVSSCDFDKRMLKVIEKYQCPIILTHSTAIPEKALENCNYSNLIDDIFIYFEEKIDFLENSCNIKPQNIIIDPGVGFCKNAKQSLEVIERLSEFCSLNKPILIGLSRKSFIPNLYPFFDSIEKKDIATLIYNAFCLKLGANIVRLHNTELNENLMQIFNS